MLNPKKIHVENGLARGLTFARTSLVGEPHKQKARDTSEEVFLESDMIVKSIGYKSLAIPGLLFDSRESRIPNSDGCILSGVGSDQLIVGEYCSGWIKTGPVGKIDNTLRDCIETFNNFRRHLDHGLIPEKEKPDVLGRISKENLVFDWNDWRKIDDWEQREGERKGKNRVKVLELRKMAEICGKK